MPQRKQAYLSDFLRLRNFERCWGCVTSKGVGALVPTSETTDTRKYMEIIYIYTYIYIQNIYI